MYAVITLQTEDPGAKKVVPFFSMSSFFCLKKAINFNQVYVHYCYPEVEVQTGAAPICCYYKEIQQYLLQGGHFSTFFRGGQVRPLRSLRTKAITGCMTKIFKA